MAHEITAIGADPHPEGALPYEGWRGAWGLPCGVPLTPELLMTNHLRIAADYAAMLPWGQRGVDVSLANAIGWASRA